MHDPLDLALPGGVSKRTVSWRKRAQSLFELAYLYR